ncbi:MAG: hypothetical protein R2878_00045 [Thermoleophilia bacterium]
MLRRWYALAALAVVTGIGGALAWVSRDQVNPDGVAYVSVARHYGSLELRTAVNGYWSPLLSWLLTPFTWLPVEPLHAARLIALVLVLIVVVVVLRLGTPGVTTRLGEWTMFAFASVLGVSLAYWSTGLVTPDFLAGVVFVLALVALGRHLQSPSRTTAIRLGICLAMLYFAKSPGLFVGLAVLGVVAARDLRAGDRRRLDRTTLVAGAAFLGPVIAWVALISVKYHRLTISTASQYNWRLAGPGPPTHPSLLPGYHPPVNSGDVWVWDDPSWLELPRWSASDHLTYFATHVVSGINSGLASLTTSSLLLVIGMFAGLTVALPPAWRSVRAALIAGGAVLVVAHAITIMEPRYLWMLGVPLLAAPVLLIRFAPATRGLLGILSFAAVQLVASLILLFTITVPQQRVEQGGLRTMARDSRAVVPPGSRVAGPQGSTYAYCYFAGMSCVATYVLSGDPATDAAAISDMRAHDVRYYVSFNNEGPTAELPVVFQEVAPGRSCYNAALGQGVPCNEPPLVIYDLAPGPA